MNKKALLKVMEVVGAELAKTQKENSVNSSLYEYQKTKIADLKEKIAQLEKENAELRQGVGHET